jgi:hypothetical protein
MSFSDRLARDREYLRSLAEGPDTTFVSLYGNAGDRLIYAGTRKLLEGLSYKEITHNQISTACGKKALLAGSGGWCLSYHAVPKIYADVAARFEEVIVLPSSYDTRHESVSSALMGSNALFMARERVSFYLVQYLCGAVLGLDGAFFFDYSAYRRKGSGTLNAFRTDVESATPGIYPQGNVDLSNEYLYVEDWLTAISQYETIRTDRAHVMIAAAMMGKRVEYKAGAYHKVPAIAEFALSEFPVTRIEEVV